MTDLPQRGSEYRRLPSEVVDMAEVVTAWSGEEQDNVVELRGRVTSAPTERELPSGSSITTFRLSVGRARTAMTTGSKQSADWVDCSAWSARARRSVGSWQVGDEVEVSGALRRRYFRSGDGSGTRLEVEVIGARRARARVKARATAHE
jgi:single-strand DNA-binding protein